MKNRTRDWRWLLLTLLILGGGCRAQSPGGSVIRPKGLGATVDEIHVAQEENAELAKLVIYTHEFEINLQQNEPIGPDKRAVSGFDYQEPMRVRGLRLTPDGQEHVRQIANILRAACDEDGEFPFNVILERSRTSKKWQTTHHYPVHFNDELDSIRREIVVSALMAQGIANADELVIVAPSFSTGLNGDEAADAYQNAILGNRLFGNRSRGNNSRRGSFSF